MPNRQTLAPRRPEPARAGLSIAVDGAAIRERRKRSGLTVTALAAGCKISKQYVSKIERGERGRVSPPVLASLGRALGVDVGLLRAV